MQVAVLPGVVVVELGRPEPLVLRVGAHRAADDMIRRVSERRRLKHEESLLRGATYSTANMFYTTSTAKLEYTNYFTLFPNCSQFTQLSNNYPLPHSIPIL